VAGFPAKKLLSLAKLVFMVYNGNWYGFIQLVVAGKEIEKGC